MSLTTDTAQQFLADNFADWVQALDLTIAEIGPSGATLRMPITPALARVGGILSGQALAAMADTSMVFACAGHMGEFRPVATTNLDTVFLRPGTGDSVRCEAEIVRAGKALMFARATMVAEPSDKPVATATATFFLP
ncbi:PaaI family thioesterase [Alisedimentitalea sp. MJ-SS2]|uniref:PaaI family thioesterase n=1 Tax=Aliisedimentitalea sp. MJ-SS2 TaxID=3049795 RepID=UPI0029080726|nr:PaaI family thioesterase [Alisedimentitalea sp. MJ-SS2]MDU8928876.1 PaaI family thioesterase [Alisedimentitalea sp. MJ-SS2]